jgi:hypothetical protein
MNFSLLTENLTNPAHYFVLGIIAVYDLEIPKHVKFISPYLLFNYFLRGQELAHSHFTIDILLVHLGVDCGLIPLYTFFWPLKRKFRY